VVPPHLVGLRAGTLTPSEEIAKELIDWIRTRLDRVKTKVKDQPRPRALICVGRTMGSGSIKDLHLVGKDGFYDEVHFRWIRLLIGRTARSGRRP